MKVALLDLDRTGFPNLALMRLSAWHRAQGDEIGTPSRLSDRVYVSCVFSWHRPALAQVQAMFPTCVVGGSGVSLTDTLPPEVEAVPPDYSLYHNVARWRGVGLGFLQRGCPRSCAFCVVPRKEGKPQIVGTLDDLINPAWQEYGWQRPFISLLDNNFLALGDWTLRILSEISERDIEVCFSQGLDIRLVTPEIAASLARVRFQNLHHTRRQMTFAFDHVGIERQFRSGVAELFRAGIKAWQLQSFVLCGFNSTIEEDMHRIAVIRSLGIDPFVMLYRDPVTGHAKRDLQLRDFARWVNRRLYKVCAWEEYRPAVVRRMQPMMLGLEAVR